MTELTTFSISDLILIMDHVKNINDCGTTTTAIEKYLSGSPFDVRIMVEEYEDYHSDNQSYWEYILDVIETELNNWGLVTVDIGNSDGGGLKTFDHLFILMRVDGRVVRIESYMKLYCSRVVEADTWRNDLHSLMIATPGPDRINIWNILFSARETRDTPFPLDVEIHSSL